MSLFKKKPEVIPSYVKQIKDALSETKDRLDEMDKDFYTSTTNYPSQQTRSISVQSGEGQSNTQNHLHRCTSKNNDSVEGSHGQGTRKPSLTSPADKIVTPLDILYLKLQERKQIKVEEICIDFKISKEVAMDWCTVLTSHNLAELSYPTFKEPVLKAK